METVDSPSLPSLTLERASPLVGPQCGCHEAGRVAREHPPRTPLKGVIRVAVISQLPFPTLQPTLGSVGLWETLYISQQP